MQELQMSPATVVILLMVLAAVIWAMRRLCRKGMCDCSDHCDGCGSKKESCSGCRAAENMTDNMVRSSKS